MDLAHRTVVQIFGNETESDPKLDGTRWSVQTDLVHCGRDRHARVVPFGPKCLTELIDGQMEVPTRKGGVVPSIHPFVPRILGRTAYPTGRMVPIGPLSRKVGTYLLR